jgi:hypothetical protein
MGYLRQRKFRLRPNFTAPGAAWLSPGANPLSDQAALQFRECADHPP